MKARPGTWVCRSHRPSYPPSPAERHRSGLAILTTVAGGTGTYATSQLQTFQTGVTLDVTPLKDNQTLVIGGLVLENSQTTVTKTPLIGDIPLIGGAFNNKLERIHRLERQ